MTNLKTLVKNLLYTIPNELLHISFRNMGERSEEETQHHFFRKSDAGFLQATARMFKTWCGEVGWRWYYLEL